jgi:hypothetical protein
MRLQQNVRPGKMLHLPGKHCDPVLNHVGNIPIDNALLVAFAGWLLRFLVSLKGTSQIICTRIDLDQDSTSSVNSKEKLLVQYY